MSDGPVTVGGQRDAMKYLRVQAGVFFVSAFLCAAIVLLVLFLGAHTLTWRDAAWMIPGSIIAIGAAVAGRWSVRQHAPTLRLAGNELSVGDAKVALDATTTIELEERTALPLPTASKVAMFRLPGFVGFPHFDGGPRVRVRTGDSAVVFQPLLYGPAAFFGAAADPQAAVLVQALTTASPRGDVSPWLRSVFAPRETPKVITSVTTFVVSYAIISALIVSFLGYLLVYALHHNTGG